ncbi:hypothetical protein RHECNPAF_5730028 [Rhizobium etli CNPAF512]|nr:hypothetical protein RHECNPAF_5730028 [Rhizobium etli CNPAF512]
MRAREDPSRLVKTSPRMSYSKTLTSRAAAWCRLAGFLNGRTGFTRSNPTLLAGIWEEWRHPAGIDIRSLAVVTCQSNEMISAVHNRMPVVLRPEDYERWLSPDPDPRGMMRPFDAKAMTMWPIARRVSTARRIGPEALRRVDLSTRRAPQ